MANRKITKLSLKQSEVELETIQGFPIGRNISNPYFQLVFAWYSVEVSDQRVP
ncbi:hypothetical protein KP764_00880 [Streptococcus equi subsp. equi]|uniref:hypothetical protein n=1 Tax=Streptococcus equi TaxID=1336 RepID=UPI001E37F3F7|nr:hypothetical protein [Streptococcus equi]MCD3501577.1 hypothetical protein [Streptococcus equi subsp. equi]